MSSKKTKRERERKSGYKIPRLVDYLLRQFRSRLLALFRSLGLIWFIPPIYGLFKESEDILWGPLRTNGIWLHLRGTDLFSYLTASQKYPRRTQSGKGIPEFPSSLKYFIQASEPRLHHFRSHKTFNYSPTYLTKKKSYMQITVYV